MKQGTMAFLLTALLYIGCGALWLVGVAYWFNVLYGVLVFIGSSIIIGSAGEDDEVTRKRFP